VNIKPSPMIAALLLAWADATSDAPLAQTAEPPANISLWAATRAMPDPAKVSIGASTTRKNGRRSSTIPNATPGKSRKRSKDALHLQAASLVADIGAGTGYFSARVAKRVPEGKVFAADVEPDMVRYLGARAEREHLVNLTPVLARPDAANLPEPVDLILVVDTYHHIDDRTRYFAGLQSSLRPSGRLVIIDFKADSPNGPPVQHRIPPERVMRKLAAAGYALTEKFEFLP